MLPLLILNTCIAAPLAIGARVHGSIEATLAEQVPKDGPALAAQVARLLRWRGDVVRDVHPGDEIRLLYEPEPEPELIALSYRGEAISLNAYRFEKTGSGTVFFSDDGVSVAPLLLNSPVPDYVQITEVVQSGRGKRRHDGLDLKAPQGTPIQTPYDGVVNRVNWRRHLNGNCIEIRYADGILARFLHMETISPEVKVARRLPAGTKLGTVGSTGHSGAPHLHYDLRDAAGRIQDPLSRHGTRHVSLSGSEKEAFDRLRRGLDALLAPLKSAS